MNELKRNCAFNPLERNILIDLIELHKDKIENKKTDSVSNCQKNQAWLQIETEYNSSHGVAKRDVKQLKK